ncbi:MAG: DUF4190 domain-containing protein, partial [Salinibacterium sp.]|nr:DUF4190 domain-containing protein [Salinibacterium sp.]
SMTDAPYTPAPIVSNPKTNTLAIVTLILGILGFNIIAVILGFVSLKQIKRTGEQGRALAIIGLILGFIGVIVIAIWITVFALAAATGNLEITTS